MKPLCIFLCLLQVLIPFASSAKSEHIEKTIHASWHRHSTRYRPIFEQGYVGPGYGNQSGVMQFHIINGIQTNDHLYFGLGSGIHDYVGFGYYVIPIFLNMRTTLTDSDIAPYTTVSLGYALGANDLAVSGPQYQLGIGIRKMINRKTEIMLHIAYERYAITSYSLEYSNNNYALSTAKGKHIFSGISLNFAIAL